MPRPSTSCWATACCHNHLKRRLHSSTLLQLGPDQAGTGAVQDRTLRSVACNALATAAFAAPGKVLPLVVQRFQVCPARCRLSPGSESVGWLHGARPHLRPLPGMHERPAPACTAVIGLRSPSDLGRAIQRATQEPELCPSSSVPLTCPPFSRPAALCSQPRPAAQEALVSLSAAHQLVSALHTLSHCLRPLLLAGGPQLPTGTLDSLVGPTCWVPGCRCCLRCRGAQLGSLWQ